MHAIYSHTENTYIDKNESNHSEMGPVKQNSIQMLCLGAYMYVDSVRCIQTENGPIT